MNTNRREFIKEMGALGLARWIPSKLVVQAADVSLQRLAAEKGLLFGSCLALKYFVQSAAYQQLFLAQCDIATPEVHMKWNSLSNQPGIYDFSNADKFVTFCATNRIRVRAHTLVWHDALPAWVTSAAHSGEWASHHDRPHHQGSRALCRQSVLLGRSERSAGPGQPSAGWPAQQPLAEERRQLVTSSWRSGRPLQRIPKLCWCGTRTISNCRMTTARRNVQRC